MGGGGQVTSWSGLGGWLVMPSPESQCVWGHPATDSKLPENASGGEPRRLLMPCSAGSVYSVHSSPARNESRGTRTERAGMSWLMGQRGAPGGRKRRKEDPGSLMESLHLIQFPAFRNGPFPPF